MIGDDQQRLFRMQAFEADPARTDQADAVQKIEKCSTEAMHSRLRPNCPFVSSAGTRWPGQSDLEREMEDAKQEPNSPHDEVANRDQAPELRQCKRF